MKNKTKQNKTKKKNNNNNNNNKTVNYPIIRVCRKTLFCSDQFETPGELSLGMDCYNTQKYQ